MKKTRNKERRKSGFALVKSMIALGLAAQMMLSSMLITLEPAADEGTSKIDPAAVEILDEQAAYDQELIVEEALSEPDESAPGDEILHDPHPASYSSDENLNPVQETQEFEQKALPGQEQPFNMITGPGIHISVSCGEEAGLPDGTSLEVIEDQLAPVSADQISGAYSLYTDPNERAYVEALLRESLLLEDWDALIMANVLDLSLQENGTIVMPAAPVMAELHIDSLPESMASYVSAIALDGDAAGTCLAKGMAENGGVTLRFDTYCPTRLAVCVSAKEYAYWYKEDWSFSVYGPEGTELGCEDVSLDAAGLTVQEAQHLVCYTGDGTRPGLWIAVRPNEQATEAVREDAMLYALSDGIPTELLSENGFTNGLVYLGAANGFAVLTESAAEETFIDGEQLIETEQPIEDEQFIEDEQPIEIEQPIEMEQPAETEQPAEVEDENTPVDGVTENIPADGEPESNPAESEDENAPADAEDPDNASETDGEEPHTEQNIETGTEALSLSGSVPEGVAADAVDVLEQVAELDLAALERAQLNAEEHADEQESLPAYRVLTAWTLDLTMDSEAWQPDEDHPLTAYISHEEINAERDLQLWHVRYDEAGNPRLERIEDRTVQENTLSFPVKESGLYMISCTAGFRSDAVTVTGDQLPAGISAAMKSVAFDASQLGGLTGQSADEADMISIDTQSFNAPALDLRQSLSVKEFNAVNAPLDMSVDTVPDAEQPGESKKAGESGVRYEVITAYDISLYQEEAGYQPDAEHPLDITISDPGIREAVQNGKTLQLWHVHEGAAPVQVENFEVNDDTVSFRVEDLSVFVVTYTVDSYYRDSEGETWHITATYGPDTGLPADVELKVRELEGAEAENYLDSTAATLGKAQEGVKILRAFDISFEKDGIAYHKLGGDVEIKIELLDETIDTPVEVVHFGAEKNTDTEQGSQGEVVASSTDGDTVSFSSDEFSVYVVVCTTLRQTLTASDGNEYLVTVTYDNTSGIPSDAELSVSEIKEGEAGYEEYVAQSAAALGEKPENLAFARPFDITLKNPETGEEYQSNEAVQVSIKLLKEDLNSYASVDVIHIPDGAGEEAQVMDTTVHGESVEFETDGFSVYVLIGSDGQTVKPQSTYAFWIPNPDAPGDYKQYSFTDSQGNTIFKQTITTEDELVIPQLTSTDTKNFAGWYAGNMIGGTLTLESQPYDFDNITITENSAVDLYAVYTNYAMVIFHDQYDSSSRTFPVAYTRRAELVTTGEGESANTSATVKISDLSTTYTSTGGTNMAFFGWSETPITTPGAAKDDGGNDVAAISTDAEGCITVTGEKHLYPIFKEVHRLTYYAAQSGKGADYVPPADYFAGDEIPIPLPITAMDGFTFDGWYTGTLTTSTEGSSTVETVNYGAQITYADGSLVSSADDAGAYISAGKLYLRADTTLYAHWTAKTTADYKIIIWRQNPSDTDGLEDENKTYSYAESAILTGTIGTSVTVSAEHKEKTYAGYTYSRCDDAKSITADGSMVLNVYYDKNSDYTPSGTYTLTFVDSVTEVGKTSKDLPVEYTGISYDTSITEKIPANPTSGRNGYVFSNWYLDQACTIPANLSKMPDHDLTVYAGWETGWYVVTIDPNYGALYAEENGTGTGATWFWSSFEGEPIGEYTHVTRNYVESSSGTWYFVDHSGDGKGGSNGWADRHTYYTQNPALATEDTTFEYAPGVYTYAGWYEVYLDEDGNEIGEASEPYDFSQHTDHNTKLRLHWKKEGTYYLAYDAGEGTLEYGTTKSFVLPNGYADYAGVVLTQSAIAPTGYTFIGWQVRGGDSTTIYTPGQTFTLHADDAKRVSGKDVVYLDAAYAKVGTATIVYNANGGTVAENNVDFGKVPGSSTDEWNTASGTVDTTAGTATVSGLANNSKFKLSYGTGFTAPSGSGAAFLGWSDRAVCDASATFYSKDSGVSYGVNTAEPTTLYAVWGAQVTYNLNSLDAGWGDELWDTTVYTKTGDVYSQTANLGTVISEPTNVPVYTGTDDKLFRYWATRTGEGTEESPYVYTENDFSQPITGALDLYAYWSEANIITVHAVDASEEDLADRTGEDGWTVANVTVSATETALNGTSHVTAPENYEFAFVAVASDLDAVSENNSVTAIKYENKKVLVKYKGESSFRVLGEGRELYFVYYQKKTLDIGYKSMEASGVLEDVTTSEAPTATNALLGEYSMSSQLTAPLSLATGFTNYAFAIGDVDPHSETQMNASNLSLITNAVGADDPIPTLRVRNTWRGFEYTTETGDDAVWTSCGYAPQLYVIYYSQQPTVVMFDEKTVGTSAVMNTEFTFNLLVTATTATTVSVQTQTWNGENWVNSGDPVETTNTGEPTTVFDTSAEGNQPYILKNGEANSSILFYSSTVSTDTAESGDTRTVTTTTTATAQTAVITQTVNDAFTPSIDVGGTAYADSPNVYTYTGSGSGGTVNVTFTNTHKALPVEVHVAMVENDGTSGGIMQRDGSFRSTTEANYKFDLALGTSETLLTKRPSSDVFTGDTDTYAFGTVMSGTGTEGAAITVGSMGVASIAYEPISGNIYGLVLKDSDGNTISELGSNQLYYLYYPMPKIRYVKEAADGTLTDITGCLPNAQTGVIEASDSVTYSHALLTMNGKTVEQNESFEIPLSGFVISQSGNNFRMPHVLDDDLYERYLSYVKLGAGSEGATNSSELDVSTGLTMQLKVQNNTLQYSFDGTTWTDLPLSGTPTIYAIYTERGYDFQISKTVDTSESGENAIFSNASFTVTISSDAITKDSYDAEGAESATVTATPADGTTPGTITLTVTDGTKVRIKGLGRGDYTITESGNENYILTARTGPIVGSSTSPMTVTDNTTVSFTLDTEKKVDLTNSPKAICKIDDHYFYTLRSMVEYVDSEIATKTATAEMLTDYLMPAADTVEIPNGCDITLTTAESVGRVAVITRTDDLADVSLFTNNGTLTIANLTLEGSSVVATAPMIQSAGDLTVGSGATIQNVVGGGAINAIAGNITVSGTIQKCSAAEGGAIYHSGNSTITLNGTGTIQNNTATTDNGGAIYLAGGTVKVSGTSKITGNKAESGNGGAVYCPGTVVIELDQGGSVTNNTAKEGGAIYAETGAISISKTAENVSPAITGNTATTGNGGAIHVGTGSVSVSGGSVSSNKAENGLGGAVYANAVSVTVSGTAEVKSNNAKEGGAVYAVSGAVEVSGGAVDNNTASTGNGGAIYAGSGHMTLSGGSVSGNRATAGSGGAVYAGSGNVTVSGGSLSDNNAGTDGGAICANSGSIIVTVPDGGTAATIQGNTATSGKGGALYAGSGSVSITGTALTGNVAGTDGGAVYAGSSAVTLTNCVIGGDTATDGNTAGGSGGAAYAGSGNVTVSAGSMKSNSATGGSGGALYAGSGTVTMSTVTLSGNSAAAGMGGAVYLDSGSLTLTTVTATGNSAINGAAIFTNTGRANFSDGSYTGNVASGGGAVGVGSKDARLVFNGVVQIKENKLGTENNAPKSNVYLNQDDDAVINIDTLGADASIGIYVADSVESTRGVPGARFAVYTSNDNVNKITNDRYASLTVQSDTAAKKLYWGNSIKVSVHKLDAYGSGFSQPASSGAGTQLGKYDTYYPEFSDAALSELASELVVKNSLNIGTKVYAAAYLDGVRSFGDYITELKWDKEASEWYVTTRSGDKVYLKKTDGTGYHRIYIYYAEPAYLSIENNTDMALSINAMTVDGISVINSTTVAGYGMVFAKNGAIRSALLPVTAEDLQLSAGQSINLLIPGGQNKAYTLDGSFETTTGGTVRLRRTGMAEETLAYSGNGKFNQLSGTTLNTAGTYNVIFGDNKIICKVVDADGTEHPYSKISDAISDIVASTGTNPPYTLKTAKTATIEMVTDYLLPASDHVLIPRGYDITLTTAAPPGTEGVTYIYHGVSEDGRSIISRDSENKYSMIDAWNSAWNYDTGKGTDNVTALDSTVLRISNLVLDGKSVRGESDGGAVASKYVNVYVDTVDFKNVYASNGGAMLIMFSAKDKNNKATVPNTILEVKNSNFTGCTSTTTEKSNRLGGGGIVTNAERMTLENSVFTNCTAVDQAGGVFHRVDGNYNSWTNVTGCTFTNCSANAAGGLELDSKTITVTDCTFEHCSAKERNGGGFNVWPLNSGTTSTDCWVTVTGCTFNDCQVTDTLSNGGNGGGFRCTAVYTTVQNCTFTNNTAYYGGGFCVSNTNAKKTEIYGCTFERNTANQGGGVLVKAKEVIIGDYTYTDTNGEHTIHTQVKNCTSKQEGGGGIRHDRDVDGSSLMITNAVISGNEAKSSSKNGGGVFTNARTVTIAGSTITDNTCTNKGGGVYAYSYTSMTITDSDISRNIASSDGGGVWLDANNDSNRNNLTLTIKGSSIDGNTSNGIGGGVYTLGKTVTIGASDTKTDSNGKYIRSSISNNSAKNGGGVYQSRNVAGSKLEISDTSISGNAANGGTGGGVYAGVRTLTVTSTEISRNSATSDGGGIWYEINNDDARKAMKLTVEGCTLDTNTSGGKGGGIYTLAKTVEIKEHTEGTGEDAVTTPTTISNCTASASGGGFYHNKRYDGTSLTIENSKITGCTANDTATNNVEHGGGGIFGAFDAITIVGSEISNNSAVRNGGGINAHLESNNYSLIIDNTKIVGNSSGNLGGGIYTRSQLTLRNGTEITGNRLTTNTAANCAGVYLNNNRTLFVGSEGAATDTIIVRGNTTANGTLSDLRLWDNGSENNSTSTYVYCSLSDDSEIRVVNAAKVSTWFGSAEIAYPNGFSDDNAVFRADSSTLHGIIDRTDPNGKKIIWAGPPIAKLTDGGGTLLYIRYTDGGALYPAIFDRLDTGNNSAGSTVSPFNMLRMSELTLYYADGTDYTGSDYCIKMLVEYYETTADMTLPYVEGRTVTFTTAGKSDADYPFEGKAGGRSTVIRGSSVSSSRTLLNVFGDLILENIVIDGGTENGVTVNSSTRCMWIDNENCTVTLGENAVLQNGHVNTSNDGGGVYVNKGALKISGGVIRNCTAKDGGGVYMNNGSVTLTAGSIYQCSAITGGGVRIKSGSFMMSGGTVQGCSATNGGGVCVAGGKSMYMSGGSIINNSAVGTGGGIMVYSNASRLYFSGKVNISGNTSEASVAKNHACNVELNYDSNAVINTNNGGLYAGSYIGVYVPDGTSLYDKHGAERMPFGTFATNDNTATFYSFVNDRNGLKGGIIENPSPNTIYWIQIFSLEVSKEVESGDSTAIDSDEQFLFKVNIRGNATVTGQLNAAQIDSDDGEYGEMHFDSNGRDTTTAVFALKDGESITGVNLSEGLTYEVIEYLTVEQADRYAAMPMNGYNLTTESLTYNGTTYRVIKANTYTSTIGENKSRSDVDPYTSSLKFTNLMPVCKITDMNGNLLYRRYNWDKVTNKTGEGADGGSSTDQPYYYAPAVYTELTGDDGAFKALEGTLYTSNGSNPTSYSVSNGVQIQMLIADYSLYGLVAANTSKATLTTASSGDALFPKQDAGTTSTIRRAFADDSMFNVTGDLTLSTIILDGVKGSYTIEANGGIANVQSGGKLTIQSGAVLQNSRSAENYYGGAVYVASGGSVTMTGGMINRNESVDNGAGIYLAEGSTLKLSDAPSFGGTGRDVSGNITTTNGNFKTGELLAQKNGGKAYTKARQDIYIAEAQDDPASVVLTGNLNVDAGSIWVWAATENHYAMMKPFAAIASGTVYGNTYAAFRNAQPDSVTNCGEDNYLSGSSGENASFIYWAGGFDISFKKINGFGTALSGATFTLYTDSACTETLKQGGADAAAVSADGTATYKDKTGATLDAGSVLFEQIPAGVYYMKETVTPDGHINALTKDASGNPVPNVYIVLVGDAALQGAGVGALVNITQEQITAQTGTGDDKKDAAIFLIDPSTSLAVATPDIAKYGIMNISTAERKAILKKVSNTYSPLDGAIFEILRYDHTLVSSTDINGATTTSFTSGASGVYFIDMMPYGTYYLHETTIPSGYQKVTAGNDGNWFILTVNENGVGYEQATDTGTAIRNTLSPEATKPN